MPDKRWDVHPTGRLGTGPAMKRQGSQEREGRVARFLGKTRWPSLCIGFLLLIGSVGAQTTNGSGPVAEASAEAARPPLTAFLRSPRPAVKTLYSSLHALA